MSANKNFMITIAVVSLTLLAFAPSARANANDVSSVDWTYQPVSNGSNFWVACVALKNGSSAGLSYNFVHSAYSQSGNLNTNGCFTVSQMAVGLNFSYGSSYTLTAGNSKAASFVVTTVATLGGSIVPSGSSVMVLVLGGIGAAAVVLGVGFFAARRKHWLVSV
jgi:hypothetical protein